MISQALTKMFIALRQAVAPTVLSPIAELPDIQEQRKATRQLRVSAKTATVVFRQYLDDIEKQL